MAAIDTLLGTTGRYTESFPYAGLAAPPTMKVAVLTCMDARIDPARIFGLEPGDAHVIRNAGGVVSDDARRSLVVSQRVLGTREIMVVWHTGCGMSVLTERFQEELAVEVGEPPGWRLHPIGDLADDLRAAVRSLRADRFLVHTDTIRGVVYDVTTGSLTEVC
ncbi:MAG TPA: carbonic anhydrase [Mycobacteriales bacterium]|nr:carbonic anhydrase [Mycobacteriales bacterium]